MPDEEEGYDFFIAHAGGDTEVAERFFDLLSEHARVFLDTRSLRLGDQWDVVLPRAQRQARVTVVVVSPRTESAFYQREEVAAAIELARRERHRVVPVFVDGPPSTDDVPYGLRRIHHAMLSDSHTVEDVARQLLDLIPGDLEGAGAPTRPPGSVPLVLSVVVPSDTDDAWTPVYIAGTLDLLDGDLPRWDPAGVRLTRVDSTLWSIELSGVPGTTVAYKFTLGSWVRVEKDAHGEEIDDRRLTVEPGPDGAHRQEDEVERWQDVGADRRDP